MPVHSSRRPVESTVAPRPRPGRTRIKVVGLLLTLALVAGQPVAKAILPSEPDGPTTLAGSSSTASGALDQPEPEALEQQDHQLARDQGAVGAAAGTSSPSGAGPAALLGAGVGSQTQDSQQQAQQPSNDSRSGQFFELSFNPDTTEQVQRAQPVQKAQQTQQGCAPADTDCQDRLFCQAYPTSCVNGQKPTAGPSGPVQQGPVEATPGVACPDANDDQVCDPPPTEQPAQPAPPAQPQVPACVAAGGRDGDGDGVCDDQDNENGDALADVDQDIDQDGCLDSAQAAMAQQGAACNPRVPDINGNGQDDQFEDWDGDGTSNKDDIDLDGDGSTNRFEPPVPGVDGMPTPAPATQTPAPATPTATPTATAMATPTATPTATPAATPPAAAPPAAELGGLAGAIAGTYQWLQDCVAYTCGEALLGLPIAIGNLITRQRTPEELATWDRALQVPQPDDQLLDPLNGITVAQAAPLVDELNSPEAKQVYVQAGLEALAVGAGHILSGAFDGILALGRKAFGRTGTTAIEEGADQAIHHGDDLPAGDQAPFLPTPRIPAPRPPAVTVRSAIGDSRYATDVAEGLSDQAQRDVNNVLNEFMKGNDNPGLGKRSLRDGYFELRGRNNGRVILKQTGPNQYDIVGKFEAHTAGADKDTRLIQRLKDEYERTHPKP
jgi:hypothetical protein